MFGSWNHRFGLALCWAIVGIIYCNPINPSAPGDMSSQARQAAYLERFGYLQNEGAQVTQEVFHEALKKFQKKWGLQETGQVSKASYNRLL